jgi:hypothetical protein
MLPSDPQTSDTLHHGTPDGAPTQRKFQRPIREIIGWNRKELYDVYDLIDWLHDHAESAYLHAASDPYTPVNLLHLEYGLTVIRKDGVNHTVEGHTFEVLELAIRFVAETVCGQPCQNGQCGIACQRPAGHIGQHNCVRTQ